MGLISRVSSRTYRNTVRFSSYMYRASRALLAPKRKWNTGADPLKSPRRVKPYTYIYRPEMAKDKMVHMKQKHNEYANQEEHHRATYIEHKTSLPEYRTAGVVDPFFNELYLGRLNQD